MITMLAVDHKVINETLISGASNSCCGAVIEELIVVQPVKKYRVCYKPKISYSCSCSAATEHYLEPDECHHTLLLQQ